MRKDRVWMKFKKDDFNQLMGVLSKQIERYEEIEAQNLNLKADIQDEKECLLDLQNKIWRYSHFEKESELITMDMFPSEVKNLFLTFLENSFYEHDYTNESYFDEYLKKHEECIYQAYEEQIKEAMKHYYNNEITLEELAESVKEAENDNGYSHKDFLVLTNYQEEISSHLFDAVDWQYPDTLFNEWIDSDEINLVGNKYIFTAGMELNDFLKMEYLKDFQQGNVNILEVDGKQYISLQDLVNIDIDRYSDRCLKVYYENEKRESKTQEKIMQFQSNLEFVNKKYENADVVLIVWATEMCREQGLADYYPVQDVKDAFKTMEYIDEKEAIEIVLNDSEETLIYHKSPEEECFTKEALKHETINFDKESKMEEDLDELEK